VFEAFRFQKAKLIMNCCFGCPKKDVLSKNRGFNGKSLGVQKGKVDGAKTTKPAWRWFC
jgi:hypothetical protein